MKRRWKSLLLAWNWVLLSLGTSILIILTQPISPVPAQQPPTIEATKKPSEPEKPANTPEATEKKPSETEARDKKPSDAAEPPPTPEQLARRQKLMEGDKLYLAGNLPEAEKMYRLAKAPFTTKLKNQQRKAAIIDPAQLSPAGKVY